MVKISLLSPLVTPTFRFAACKIHSSFCPNQCSLMVILSMLVFWKDIMMLRDIGNCCDCSGCIWWEEHQVTGMARQFEVFGMWEYSMLSFKACDLDTFLPPLASPFPHAQISCHLTNCKQQAKLVAKVWFTLPHVLGPSVPAFHHAHNPGSTSSEFFQSFSADNFGTIFTTYIKALPVVMKKSGGLVMD